MKSEANGWTFAQTPIWTICDPRIPDGALRLFSYLAWRQGDDLCSWPSIDTISRDLHVNPKTVRRDLRSLEELGYLTITHRTGRSSHYTIHPAPRQASAALHPPAPLLHSTSPPPDPTPPPAASDPAPPAPSPPNTTSPPTSSRPHPPVPCTSQVRGTSAPPPPCPSETSIIARKQVSSSSLPAAAVPGYLGPLCQSSWHNSSRVFIVE